MKRIWFRVLSAFMSMLLFISVVSFNAGTALADETEGQSTEDFVKRGYTLMLDREAEEDGLNYWTSELNNHNINAAQMITLFSESPEFKSKEYSNEKIVEIFYNVMLSREAEPEGKAYWLEVLDTGFSTRHIVNGFASSAEFNGLCQKYGITSGSVDYVESRDLNVPHTKFVSDCYRNILKRNPEAEGLNYWTAALANNEVYPEELIQQFFYSEEGQKTVTDNSSFIDALYLSFMGRAADEGGKNFWLDSMKNGESKDKLFDEFKNSPEFAGILSDHDLSLRPEPEPEKVSTIDPNKPMVALTFDDGPYAPVTNHILDLCEQYDCKATFFVVGNRVPIYASCVQRAYELGCEIANHTFDHENNLANVSGDTIKWEITGCNDAVKSIIGEEPTIMRPCGGSFSDVTKANVGMPMIIWSLDTQDWKNRDTTKTANAILNNVKDGDIILMHDLYSSTGNAMDIVIPELIARGYQLVTVSELAEAKGIDLEAGEAYYSIR